MKKIFILLLTLMLVILPASAKAHGEETGTFPFLGGDNEKTEDVVTEAEEKATEETVEEVEVKELDIEDTSFTETEDAQEIIDEIKSSEPVANENSSAKKQVYIFTNNTALLESIIPVSEIKYVKYFDEKRGIVAIIPESYFDDLTSNKISFYTVEDYKKLMYAESVLVDEQYTVRKIERERMELSYNEIQKAEEEAAEKLEELEISEGNPYAYYFMYTDELPEVSTPSAAYSKATAIYYMSDKDLWEQTEKWISPNQVYEITPSLSTNPSGLPVSDCEEHAMTFVALCREAGVKASDVRVVTGYVKINGESYGHAWAQLKVDDEWVNIETTSGSYYEDGTLHKVTPLDMYFYQDITYPVVEIWSYFNDEYYVSASGRNAPDDWQISETPYSVGTTDTSFGGFIEYVYNFIKLEIYKIF